jgi:hypothetical protein
MCKFALSLISAAVLFAGAAAAQSIPVEDGAVFKDAGDRKSALESAKYVTSLGNKCFSISGGISLPRSAGQSGFRLMCDRFKRVYDIEDNGVNRQIFKLQSSSPNVL